MKIQDRPKTRAKKIVEQENIVEVPSVEFSVKEELYEIADSLRWADSKEKEAATLKKELRDPFLSLITEVVRDEVSLAQKSINIPNDGTDVEGYVKLEFPEWRVLSIEPGKASLLVTIQEREDLKKYEFVYDGYKFGRTIRRGTPSFDAEGFWENEKDIVDTFDIVKVEMVPTYVFNEVKAQKLMLEHPEYKDVFQKYITLPPPTVSLLPIKPVRDEDV